MTTWLRRISAVILLLCLQPVPAIADTAAGIAAYDEGDYETARKLLQPEAEKGDAAAQVKYGLIFAKGLGVERDTAESFKWFQKASAQGNAEAMYCMGVAYDVGDAGSKDPAKAAEWYRKAAEQGYAKAQYNLGQMLQSGDGIRADPEESVKWLQKAADQSEASAEARLSFSYVKGLGIEQSLLAARYWAERAERHGSDKGKLTADLLRREFARMEQEDHVPRTTGGDGSSFERAIALPDAKTEFTGVDAEYAVMRYFFPGWSKRTQRLVSGPENRPFDVITVENDGDSRDIYFDITNWFGHME